MFQEILMRLDTFSPKAFLYYATYLDRRKIPSCRLMGKRAIRDSRNLFQNKPRRFDHKKFKSLKIIIHIKMKISKKKTL